MNATKVAIRNSLVFWRMWRGSLIFSFLNPVLFLASIGLGIGAMVSRQSPGAFGGVGYLSFFSAGMLAATCMQTGSFSGSFPIASKINYQRNYEAMLATPLRVRDLVFGELAWMAVILATVAVPFFAVMWAFGVPRTPLAVLSIPAAILTGVGFGAAVMAYAAVMKTENSFAQVFRFVITPLFLFSGTFFPLDEVPSWIEVVANFTPLYHGVELVRGVTLYGLSGTEAIWHIGYLAAFLAAATWIAIRTFSRKLVS